MALGGLGHYRAFTPQKGGLLDRPFPDLDSIQNCYFDSEWGA